jgi:hypothetical protein
MVDVFVDESAMAVFGLAGAASTGRPSSLNPASPIGGINTDAGGHRAFDLSPPSTPVSLTLARHDAAML